MVAQQGPCFIVGQSGGAGRPSTAAAGPAAPGRRQGPRGPRRLRRDPTAGAPWREPHDGSPGEEGVFMQAGRAGSVELNGAAVVLTVLALLLRGAHEAAQKIPWKQTQVPSGAQQLHTLGTPGWPGNPTCHAAAFPGWDGMSPRECSACLQGPGSWGKTPSAHPWDTARPPDSPGESSSGPRHGEATAERACACASGFTERSGRVPRQKWCCQH